MRITGPKSAPLGEELRTAGEHRVRTWQRESTPPTIEELQFAISELHVYEAELEIQNEELIQSRRTLEESQRRYFRQFDLAPVGLIRLTSTGQIAEANILGAQMLGIDRRQIPAARRTMLACVAPDCVEAFQQHLEDALHSGKMETCELTFRSSTGLEKPVRVQTVKSLNEDGTTDLYITAIEFAERRQLQAELVEQKAISEAIRVTAEAARLTREQFFAMLTHELRTPLTPVLALLGELEKIPGRPMGESIALATMRRNLEMEVHLIEDLLDLVRISNGKLSCKRELINMHLCLSEGVEVCRAGIVAKGLHLELKLHAEQYFADADSFRIKQVLWNLLTNATKFTPPGGRIEVSTSNTADGRLVIEVHDTGIGIEAEMLRNVFEAFNQGKLANAGHTGGLGLGLSIAKSIAESHEGRLTARSAGLGEGATFCFELPSKKNRLEDSMKAAPASTAPPRREGLRLLLVEDHTDIRLILQRGLNRCGYTVDVAADAASASALCVGQTFDLVISDLGLPDLSGHELLQQLSKDYQLRGIAISGYSEGEDLARSTAAGFLEHLVKPFDVRELDAAIQRAVAAEPSLVPVPVAPTVENGKERELEALVEEHFSHAYRFALCMTLDHHDAAALIEVVAANQYREGRGTIPTAQMDRVALFAALHHEWLGRRSQPNATRPESPAMVRQMVLTRIHPQASEQTVMQTIVHSMPDELRLVLDLFYFEQLGHIEIMRILQLPVDIVRSRLAAANTLLQQHLQAKRIHL